MTATVLSYKDHPRQFNNLRYVYPVVSRRAAGVSLGINLNLNNSCNWRCIYCQVDGLIRGKPAPIDLAVLEQELDFMLNWILKGDFLIQHAPAGLQRFNDICLAGNGEPTLSPDFASVCQLIAKLRAKYQLTTQVKSIVISNGSEVLKPQVQDGLTLIAANNGALWFKIDRASPDAIARVNQVNLNIATIKSRLIAAAQLCPTFIQSCWFKIDGQEPSAAEVSAFIELVTTLQAHIQGVLLYSTARTPALSEGQQVSSVSNQFLQTLAEKLRHHQIMVSAHV